MSDTRTTIWRGIGGTPTPIAKMEGLPDPVPGIGFRVDLPEYGEGVCIGYEYDGTGRDAEIIEVKLLVRSSPNEARKWRI